MVLVDFPPKRGEKLTDIARIRPQRLVYLRPVEAAQAAVSVDLRARARLADERGRVSAVDRHRVSGQERRPERVQVRLVDRLVSVGRRDALQAELRVRRREHDRHHVVVPGVAVEPDREGVHEWSGKFTIFLKIQNTTIPRPRWT